MDAREIVAQLESWGKESIKRVLMNHGIPEPLFGVKIEDLKKIQKKVKKDHALALALYDTGIYDARYRAGLIADETKMTRKDLKSWLARANCAALCEYPIAWVAAESPHGRALALEWIDSRKEATASAGWSTLAGLVAITADDELDLAELKKLLARVQKTIHDQPNRVRYAMNSFVIALGCSVAPLHDLALAAARKIGPVSVDMAGTACKVPFAPDYIEKVEARGTLGKKRTTVRC